MKWFGFALLVLACAGCGKKNATVSGGTGNSPQNKTAGANTAAAKRPPLSRAVGEKKFNGADDAFPVGSSMATVVAYFGQEPDRVIRRAEDDVAIWVLDDGSEIEVDFYMGKSGSSRADLKQKN